jgi:hypothetical protein
MTWEEFESYVAGLSRGNGIHDDITVEYYPENREPYRLGFMRWEAKGGDDYAEVVFGVNATGKTILHAADLLRDLVDVHKRRLPSGVKGLLPGKPRGKQSLRRIK